MAVLLCPNHVHRDEPAVLQLALDVGAAVVLAWKAGHIHIHGPYGGATLAVLKAVLHFLQVGTVHIIQLLEKRADFTNAAPGKLFQDISENARCSVWLRQPRSSPHVVVIQNLAAFGIYLLSYTRHVTCRLPQSFPKKGSGCKPRDVARNCMDATHSGSRTALGHSLLHDCCGHFCRTHPGARCRQSSEALSNEGCLTSARHRCY